MAKDGSLLFRSKTNGKAEAAVLCIVGAFVATAFIVEGTAKNKADENKADLEVKLAQDADMKKFNVAQFEWMSEESDYFFIFTGNALKSSGEKINFLSSKYKVSQESYDNIVSFVEKEKMNDADDFKKLFPKILNIVAESELVETQEAQTIPNAVYNEKGDVLALRAVTKPVVNKAAGTCDYLVEVASFNEKDQEDCTHVTFIIKKVSVPLTAEMEENPDLAFLADEKDCTVETVDKDIIEIKDNDILLLQDY